MSVGAAVAEERPCGGARRLLAAQGIGQGFDARRDVDTVAIDAGLIGN
jgi:hypothetical protein